MGAKTALLAFSDGDLRPALLGATKSSPAEAEAFVRQAFPGYVLTPADDITLFETYPPDDVTYATVLPGAELLCDRSLMLDRPSELPEHLRHIGAGRRVVLHGMHSAVDWLGFAVWESGALVRSLSLSPDGGIQENLGDPYDFERAFWAGEHPVDSSYPLPFHPLELGEAALRALFGFILEGTPAPDDLDADSVHLHAFSRSR
ncbi:hypothetical protein [Actinoplanes sp. TFC3]|uniref:DUF6928 family protein n=1 Tax=Actinoplanes sp. TFC3 TaxID=1710355 RepID=UPI00082B67AD|nr:hypothetical protein [Actinoplanes sp. TFC3]